MGDFSWSLEAKCDPSSLGWGGGGIAGQVQEWNQNLACKTVLNPHFWMASPSARLLRSALPVQVE